MGFHSHSAAWGPRLEPPRAADAGRRRREESEPRFEVSDRRLARAARLLRIAAAAAGGGVGGGGVGGGGFGGGFGGVWGGLGGVWGGFGGVWPLKSQVWGSPLACHLGEFEYGILFLGGVGPKCALAAFLLYLCPAGILREVAGARWEGGGGGRPPAAAAHVLGPRP